MLKNRLRNLLIGIVYAIGIAGILASSSGSSRDDDFTCALVVSAIAPTTDGSDDIWVGVLTKTSEGNVDKVVRLDSEGNQIAEYVVGGGGTDTIRTLAVELGASNNLYVGGDFPGGIIRLDPDAIPDPAFAVGTGFDGPVRSIVPLVTFPGRIYVGGLFNFYDGTGVSSLVRLNDVGNRDIGFIAIVSDVASVALEGTGDVYSGGNGFPAMERWDNNGNDDSNFTSTITQVSSVTPALDGTGKIYAATPITRGIVRLFDTGTADTAGFVIGTGFDGTVSSIERTADGTNEIYAGGNFSTYDGTTANGIIRLNTDGSRDLNFITGDGFETPGNSLAGSEVLSLARATDGTTDLYVGGGFTHYDGSLANGLVRLNDDGTRDPDFEVSIDTDDGTCTDDSPLDQ